MAVETKPDGLENPKTPAAILGVGTAIWKIVSFFGNFDFVLSMREERLALIFESLLKWGWILLLLYAIYRYWKSPTNKSSIHWEMVAYVGILTFMFGVLLATWASGGVPTVIVGWGADTEGCSAIVDTKRLVGFSDNYKVAIACLVEDPTTDKFEDDRLAVSNAFTITGGSISIQVPYQGTKMKGVPQLGQLTSHTAFLFPKDEDVRSIKRLSEVKKYGGILLRAGDADSIR